MCNLSCVHIHVVIVMLTWAHTNTIYLHVWKLIYSDYTFTWHHLHYANLHVNVVLSMLNVHTLYNKFILKVHCDISVHVNVHLIAVNLTIIMFII